MAKATRTVRYEYHPYDPGIFMEVYLPKKPEYQGILYDTLTQGFHIENVKSQLGRNWDRIKEMMSSYYTVGRGHIDEMQQVFYGYSMFEVDGVFFDENLGAIEERTQVIRLMFRLDPAKIENEYLGNHDEKNWEFIRRVMDDYLSVAGTTSATGKQEFIISRIEAYKAQWPELGETVELTARALSTRLRQWELDIVCFVLGYFIYEVCERIKMLHESTGRLLEEEIWITTFSNLRITRIMKKITAG